jgi:hypothetical protein
MSKLCTSHPDARKGQLREPVPSKRFKSLGI